MRIDEAVKEQSEKPDWPIPEPREDQPKAWLRLDCPFCTGKRRYKRGNTAAVNYDAGWFSCFRCDRNVSARGTSMPVDDNELAKLLIEFKEQIQRQVYIVKRKFGDWVEIDELYSYAAQLVWGYAYRPYGDPNDSGMLWEWESDLGGNTDELKGYVSKALYGDLMNHAVALARWKREIRSHEIPMDSPEHEDNPESPTDFLTYLSHRADSHLGDLTDEWVADMFTMAEMDKVPFTAWGMDGQCKRIRNGLWHADGCCSQSRSPA